MSKGNNAKITVVRGDITEQPDCEAVVNSANHRLLAGAGVCGAIYRAAGPKLEPCSVQLAPLALGSAVVTPGFNLPNRLIIHTLGPKYLIDPDPSGNLASAMRNTLLLADENKVTRVAVPAISMGIFAYPPMEAIPILVRTAHEMVKQLQYVKEIRFVVLDDDLFGRLSEEIKNSAHLD
ncbi:macro domain-containing protein [Propionivibrio sp.]|uniref:macro domain-containing protein n=1 Tax=Propionivibrio sp. TaxID=2212460 RepID=UPI003BF07B80